MCLENCLMIGIMMPVGVSCLSTLLPMNAEKTDPAEAKQALLDASLYVPCHSKPSSPPHVNQNYTTSRGLSPGGTFVTMSSLQNSLFMPQHNVSG